MLCNAMMLCDVMGFDDQVMTVMISGIWDLGSGGNPLSASVADWIRVFAKAVLIWVKI